MLKVIKPDEKFYRAHVTFTSVSDMIEATKPLTKIGLSYFTFDRTYQDASHLRLTNAGEWIESYYRIELYKAAIFEKDPKIFSNGYVLWDWLCREPIYSAAAEHNIDQGLTIIERHDKHADFFHFGTTCDNLISQEALISYLDYLYRFIAFFKQKMHKLIKEAENARIILPGPDDKKIQMTDLKHGLEPNMVEFLKNTEVTRIYLGSEFNNNYLTKREIDILRLLTEGKKTVDIAEQLELAGSTLETHIKHIKEKFNCDTLFELGFRLGEISILNIYPFKIESEEQ